MSIIETIELPGKKGKTRTVFRVPLQPNPTTAFALGLGFWSGIHCKSMHTYDYVNGYVEFMSLADAEIYTGN
jgi:hypothetical protein